MHRARALAACGFAAGVLACGGSAHVEAADAGVDANLHLTSVLPVEAGPDVVSYPVYTPAAPVVHPHEAAVDGPFPIVLMHGMGGFNSLDNLPITISYFNGVQADLKAHGESQVFVTVAPPYNTSEVRAQSIAPQLDQILQQTGAKKLNLIGHSQGGMDARVIVSAAGLNYADRVASVTTIATPHRGTKVADLALGLVEGPAGVVTQPIVNEFLALLEQGVYSVQSNPDIEAQGTELTTSYMANTFNPKYTDAPGVVYASYAGRTNLESGTGDCDDAAYPNQPRSLDVAQVPLGATASYLSLEGETSDGLVPVASAKWGTFMECVPADHLKECGMIDQNGPDAVSGFDHLVFFRAVVARLRSQGL
jgi:triacylglycerol lipase